MRRFLIWNLCKCVSEAFPDQNFPANLIRWCPFIPSTTSVPCFAFLGVEFPMSDQHKGEFACVCVVLLGKRTVYVKRTFIHDS